MYNIAICDDDIHFIQYMKNMLHKSGLDENDSIYYEYYTGKSFLTSMEQLVTIDLLILDIQMPDINGNEIARIFREHFPLSTLVFCSGVYLPTVDSFKPNPFRYLLKEYTDNKLIKELKVIITEIKSKKIEPFVFGTWHHNSIRLKPSEILYISIGRNCSNLHINPDLRKYEFEDNIICKDRLNDLYLTLKDFGFEYAHNSYLVNLQYVKRKTSTELELIDGTTLSISRSKEKALRLALIKYVARKY